ncbi:MAG TPA: hypothetical protein VFV38_08320 [Ktedonobacteraceae bacterium]|nr:hypothetical protein [Ktedonobacteraceae bacterium]
MNTQMDPKMIGDLHRVLKNWDRNKKCLYPNCSEKPIGSHVIPEKLLKLIANNGTVLTWVPSFTVMMKNIEAGRTVEQLHFEPTAVGINTVTYPLFCGKHDSTIFAPLEQEEFSARPEQVLLLAYRAFCALTYSPPPTEQILTIAEQNGYQDSLRWPEQSAQARRFLERKPLVEARQRHEHMLLTRDYTELCWAMYLVDIPPCIACSYPFVPVEEIDSLAKPDDDTQTIRAEDVLVFSLFPNTLQQNSFCVLSWLKGSQQMQRFLCSLKLDQLSEQDLQQKLFSLAFQSNRVYLSPAWWQSLRQEQKNSNVELYLAASKAFSRSIEPIPQRNTSGE